MNEILRTPEERFANLPGFPWSPRSIDDLVGFDGLAMSFLDVGPATAPVFLCLHGEPTWSYLYRRMISTLSRDGQPRHRARLFWFRSLG